MVKFLIIRFSSIGDIVLTTPVIRCLKNQVEGAEVHYLTKAKFTPILEANPYIDKIHSLDNNFNELITRLKAEGFDYIIDLHKNLRSQRVKYALKRFSFAFDKLNIEKWLLVNFGINRLPTIHIVDRYMATVHAFSVENDGNGLDFFIHPNDEVSIDNILPDLPPHSIIIVVGGGHFTKQIPTEKLVEIIDHIQCPGILIGGKEDSSKAAKIVSLCKQKPYDLTGKLNIGQSASLIKQSDLILTPDTGMMHIAAAFKKPILSIWGNTIPALGMSAYLPDKGSAIFEVNGLKCRPCSKIGFKKCPKKHFNCMMQQDYQSVITTINLYQRK